MAQQTFCQFCGEPLGPGREFVYQVENESFEAALAEHPDWAARVLASDWVYGTPLRICKACHESIEVNEEELEQEATERDVAGAILKASVWMLIVLVPALAAYSCVSR